MKTKRKGFVEPIEWEKLQLALGLLESRGRMRDWFMIKTGLNLGLRSCDWLDMKLGDLRRLQPDETLWLTEQKTGKRISVVVNDGFYQGAQRFLETLQDRPDDEFVFKSKKGRNARISRQHAWYLLKEIAREVGTERNIGLHSLRKSFAHHGVLRFGIKVEVVSEALNHSSPRITRNYACIPEETVQDARKRINF